MLILFLMSFGNIIGVYSVFGYDADYWEVGSDILAVIDDNEDSFPRIFSTSSAST